MASSTVSSLYTFLLQNIVDGIFNSINNLKGKHNFLSEQQANCDGKSTDNG